MTELYREMTTCRACGNDDLHVALSLGNCAISDFVLPGEKLDYAPLTLLQCQHCEMLQLQHAVDKDRLYRNYYYQSGLNESMVAALRDVTQKAQRRVTVEPGDWVVDIGSNDGTLLKQYPSEFLRLGIDPSGRDAPLGYEGIYYWRTYFPVASNYWHPSAKIITCCAMFYDVEEPGEFLETVREWLHPDGILVIQMPDLLTMLRRNAFDNICHEHLTYWPTRSLYKLAQMHGLDLFDMETNDVNGGSVRYYFRRGVRNPCAFDEWATFNYRRDVAEFVQRIQQERDNTVESLRMLKWRGKKVWAYGASTKGNTLLQYYGIGPELITAVADRNPDKVGRETVTGIPIRSEEEFRAANPDYALMLPWAFADNFIERERDWLRNGRFIIPLPNLRMVGGGTADASVHAEIAKANTG